GTSSAAVLRAEPWRAADCRSVCVCVLWAFVCVACCVRLCVVCPVSEALKHLSAVDSLSRSVAELRCSLNRLSNNGSAEDGCCSLGWIQFGSSCYFFSRVSLNWDESKVWCEKQNAHLVIIITDEEWDFVTKTSIPDWYWVGLSDGRTGKWEWVNHTPYTVEHRRWRPGQPDNWVVLVLGSEDCAHLYADGLLNDLHCLQKMRFICQKHV
uniref:C-type lectin domain-containing protein n=1 Tax=Oryzias sinensis TaxID=183150 RepID=A0A8C8DH04_9TELE